MEFNSLAYLLFLPTVFALYWLGGGLRWRNGVVVAASFLFYGWWDWRFLCLMIATCALNFAAARWMERTAHRKWLCGATLAMNFGILGVFKYYDFFAESLDALLQPLGIDAGFPLLHLILPVGISFYTFQVTGYVIDVYRRQTRAVEDVMQFFAFVSFFPQLVAGPIERSSQLLPRFGVVQRFDRAEAVEGMRRILWGLMKKMLLADNCGAVADQIFSQSGSASIEELWLGALCFAFQIYGDFSGYSDMAIGSARLFGIRLMENFDRPYLSRSIPDFWRRWHISLMTWLRDYVYIPLGGNRHGVWRKWRNTFAVFVLSGLWHGAGWTFVCWGIWHALLFVPYSLVGCLKTVRSGLTGLLQGALCFVLVLIGWVMFRAENMAQAGRYIYGMLGGAEGGGYAFSRMPLLFIALFMAAECFLHGKLPFDRLRHRSLRMLIYLLLFLLTLWFGGRPATFIYFQF